MFTVDTVVDTTVKNTKTVLAYVPIEEVRTSFETIVDAQADFTKTVYNTGLELTKQVMDSMTQFNATAKKAK
jgi:DNA-binding winged helix-turn-helix (wHTH) protein